MLRRISIKHKLIYSFLLIVILIGVLGFYSNTSITKSNDGFLLYKDVSHSSLLIKNIQVKTLRIRNAVNKYLTKRNKQNIEKFESLVKETGTLINDVKKITINKKRLKEIENIKSLLFSYKTNFNSIANTFSNIEKIKKKYLIPNAKTIVKNYKIINNEYYKRKSMKILLY